MKTKELLVKTLKVVEKIVDVNGEANLGICKAQDGTDVYVLGNNIFASPIEIYMQKEKGFYGVLFYNTMDMKNWSWELRQSHKGYFINDGKWYTMSEDETTAVLVSTTEVLNKLKSVCETFMLKKSIKPKFIHF